MRKWSIYEHPDGRIKVVKEGWSWPAFLFSLIWLPYKMLWIETIVFYGFIIMSDKLPQNLISPIFFILIITFGIICNKRVANKLKNKGFEQRTTIEAKNKDAALAIYLNKVNKITAPPKPDEKIIEPLMNENQSNTTYHTAFSEMTTPLNKISDKVFSNDNSTLINLNKASESELASLPGVGPILAKKAITVREKQGYFKSVDDFINFIGVKPHYVDKIKKIATVSPIENNQSSFNSGGRIIDF